MRPLRSLRPCSTARQHIARCLAHVRPVSRFHILLREHTRKQPEARRYATCGRVCHLRFVHPSTTWKAQFIVQYVQTKKTRIERRNEQDKAPGLFPAANHIARQCRSGISPKHCGSCEGFGNMHNGVVNLRLALRATSKPPKSPKHWAFQRSQSQHNH